MGSSGNLVRSGSLGIQIPWLVWERCEILRWNRAVRLWADTERGRRGRLANCIGTEWAAKVLI